MVPDPGGSTYGEPETPEAPPTLGRVLLSSLLEIPTAQSIATDLADLRRHNRRIEQQRYLREELLHTGLGTQKIDPDQYRRYRELRAQAAADEFLEELTRQLNGMVAVGTLPMAWRAAYEFNSEAYRLRRLRLAAAEYDRLPSEFPGEAGDAFAQLSGLGPEAIARSAYVALDLADRAMELCYSRELRCRPTGMLGEQGLPAERECAADQHPVTADGPVAADLEVGPAELALDLLVALLDPVRSPYRRTMSTRSPAGRGGWRVGAGW